MEVTLLMGIIITLIAMVVALDSSLEGFFIFRPIIVCPLIGLAVGDLETGLLAAGIVELAFAGITAVGGVVPPDAVMTSIMTVVLAKTTGQPVAAAFALAVPFGLLAQFLGNIKSTLLSLFNKKADRYAKDCNLGGIMRLCIFGMTLTVVLYGVLTFLSVYVAQDALVELVNMMPEWLTHGFSVAGGLLPAIGFAMLLRVVLKAKYVPYLLAGFLFATFIPIDNILPVAIMGLAFALLEYYRVNNTKGGETNEGI